MGNSVVIVAVLAAAGLVLFVALKPPPKPQPNLTDTALSLSKLLHAF